MQKLKPHLWFDTQALEAAQLYVSLFEDSKILNTAMLYDTPSGDAQTVEFQLAGLEFAAISAGPYFTFNPSISLMVACETKEEVNRLYGTLSVGGSELMPLGTYDFSGWYAWISDRYGLNWQIMLVENIREHNKIRPSLLFGMEACGKAQEAMDYYTSVFSDSKIGFVNRYKEGEAVDPRAKVNYAELTIYELAMVLMDHGYGGDATFNEAISFMVQCEDQVEIDYFWEKLSFVPEAEACGWVKDQFGISWQINPKVLGELLSGGTEEEQERVTKAMLKMKKFDIAALEKARREDL
ncbi:MAG: VOC family protein [Vallitaleaceae bacterium]|nr:VOC family protein [Vallitaleaceae bacterium]